MSWILNDRSKALLKVSRALESVGQGAIHLFHDEHFDRIVASERKVRHFHSHAWLISVGFEEILDYFDTDFATTPHSESSALAGWH